MGILVMNIQSFAMPEPAYSNPRAWGGAHGPDLVTWTLDFILADGKFRGMFSWLFGASMLLVIERAGSRGARVHFLRMAWLLMFGLAHFLLVWDGDILIHYAIVGAIAFAWRNRPVEALVATALVLMLVGVVMSVGIPMQVDAAVRHAAHHPGPQAMAGVVSANEQFGVPPLNALHEALALHHGPYHGLVASRLDDLGQVVAATLTIVGPETLAYMLLGMAGLRGGFLTGAWPRDRYRHTALTALCIGGAGYALLAWWQIASNFDVHSVAWTVTVLSAPLRPIMTAGWIGLILWRVDPAGRLGRRIAAVGRMAFSNYLGTSLVCAGLFDGLGWFGRWSRAELLVVVAAVWLVMLLWSRPWLARFRYGPMEWLWRSLARGRLQPMRQLATDV